MDDRVLQFRVGVVVVAAVVITVFLVLAFGEGNRVLQQQYTIYMRFPQAPDVTVDTPVRKNGVLIGRITKVDLEDNGVLLTARIDRNYKLRRSEICRVMNASLFPGDSIIEFRPPGEEQMALLDKNHDGRLDEREKAEANEFIQDGEYTSEGIVAGNPLMSITNLEEDLRTTIRSIGNASQRVDMLALNINRFVGDDGDQFKRVIAKTEFALERIGNTMGAIDEFVSDPELKGGLRRALGEFPEIVKDVREGVVAFREASESVKRASNRAETNLGNLENFTRPLGERGPEIVQTLESAATNLDELLGQLAEFGKTVNESDGTIAKLLHDREAYDRLSRILANIEDVSRRIRPVVDDFRVFSDKIARDPRQLGIKGAIDRSPSGTGQKNNFLRVE